MDKLIIEGGPSSYELKREQDLKFELGSPLFTWRFNQAQWGAFVLNVGQLHRDYLKVHQHRQLHDFELSENENIISLANELQTRVDKLRGRV